jgi:DNA polymerase delta subunit 1
MDKPVKISPQKQNLKFQIIDWKSGDTNSKFEIQLFGVTKSGQSVTVFVKNFEPFFYIEIPDDSESDYAKFVRKIAMDMGDMSGYLKKHETVRKEKYFGYHAHKKYRFLKLVFSTEFARKKAISIIRQKYQRKLRIKCYESNLEPFLKFGHIQNIQFCGWVKINKMKYTISDREANTQLVVDADWTHVKNYDSNEIAPIRIASFDLECISATNEFPKPENAEDHIIQIGTSVLEYSTNETWKVMFSLNECDPIDNVEVVSVQNEYDLICKWVEWIKRVDADILTGYNIFGFDYHYLYHRAKLLGCEEELLSIGRLCDKDDQYVEKELSSSALGKNHLKYMNINGRVSIDLFKILQRDHKLDSYKLNFVAEHFTGQTKHDVTPNQIFEYQRKDSAHRKIVAEYCVQDCDLVIWLFQKLDIVPCNKGLADVSSVPLSYIILRGQGIKAFSLLAKECMNKGYLIEDRPRGFGAQEDNKYLGAIVLEPQKGAYLDMPVVCNDFASLYPSSIISHNLSPNTHIFDKKYLSSSDEIEVIEWEEERDDDASVGTVHHEFVKPKDDSDRGILPNILIFLLKVRKQTKKLMAQAETEDKRSVLNGLQLAYKITANSLYGQMGAVVSPVYYKAVASCTTAVGRSLLLKARDCVLKEIPGTEAVYGDSVSGDTPLLLKNKLSGNISIRTISSFGDTMGSWVEYENFKPFDKDLTHKQQQQLGCRGYQIWVKDAWVDIRRVIRHKTVKKMFRVLTHTGVVDVTEDHSLLDENGQCIKPHELENSNNQHIKLMHGFPGAEHNNYDTQQQISVEEAYVWGFFMGDGSCGGYPNCKSGMKYSWALNNSDLNKLDKLILKLGVAEPDKEFKILDTLESSGVYKLVPVGCSIKHLVGKYRPIFYDHGNNKIVPELIINSSLEVRQSFLDGYYEADGDKSSVSKRCDIKGKIGAQGLYYLWTSLGYNVSINVRTDKMDIYRLNISTTTHRKNPMEVKKIIHLPDTAASGEFVYDIETACGRFNAGVGRLTVKNTDSVFFQFPINVDSSDKKKLEEAERFGQLAEKKVNAILPYPHNFEYEKIMFPFILLTKKRYCGMKYEGDIQNPKFNAMGMALKRRDFCKVTKHILGGAIDILMTKKSVEEAADFVKENVKKTLDGEFPLDYFVLTRELRSENYKNPEAMPHYQLVLKMRERNPGIQISTSERIRMVMKLVPDAGRKNILQSQIVEDPDYLVENNERVDYRWYITNQLRKQIIEIFSILMEDPQDILDPILKEDMVVRKRIMAKMNKQIDEINRKNNNHSITNFFRVKNT